MPGVTWDADTDRKLFLFFLKNTSEKLNYEGAAAVITTDETTCTSKAVESRIKKLRSQAKAQGIEAVSTPEESDAEVPKTKVKAQPKAKATGKASKNGTKRTAPESDSEDDTAKPAPAKRSRKKVDGVKGKANTKTVKGKKKAVKEEEEEVTDEQVEKEVEDEKEADNGNSEDVKDEDSDE